MRSATPIATSSPRRRRCRERLLQRREGGEAVPLRGGRLGRCQERRLLRVVGLQQVVIALCHGRQRRLTDRYVCSPGG